MFAFIKKRKLKKRIFNEFEKAQKEKNYLMVDILGKSQRRSERDYSDYDGYSEDLWD